MLLTNLLKLKILEPILWKSLYIPVGVSNFLADSWMEEPGLGSLRILGKLIFQ